MSCFGGGAVEETDILAAQKSREIDVQLKKEKEVFKATHRLLLLGKPNRDLFCHSSGVDVYFSH